jgi:ankyrin repeat protein
MNNVELNEEFMRAVSSANIELATDLLSQGADLNTLTPKGNNALYVAAMRKKRLMFDWLLQIEQKGVKLDVNHQNANGCTLMFDAVKEDSMTYYIDQLIKYNADPNIAAYDGMIPLIKAVADGKMEEVQSLLKSPLIKVNYEIPGTKTSAFLMAVTASDGAKGLEICKLLIDNGANIDTKDANGKNALINALFRTQNFMNKVEKKSHNELCKFLVDQSIDINYTAPSGMTAFWLACMKGDRDLIELMLDKGAKTDVWHSVGMEGVESALHHAVNNIGRPDPTKKKAKNPQEEAMELIQNAELIERDVANIQRMIAGGAKINAPDETGNTPAIMGFVNPLARNLIIDLGGDVNAILHQKDAKNNVVKTPALSIIVATGDNQKELVEQMISLGAKTTYQDNKDLKEAEPIVVAIKASAVGIVETLLTKGNVDPNLILKAGQNEFALLSLVVAGGNNKTFSKILTQKNQIKTLLDAQEENKKNGVTSNIISDEKFEELKEEYQKLLGVEQQLSENRQEMFNLFIQHGADVNLENDKGYTPLFFCKSRDYLDTLLENGAVLTHKAKNDDNLLISAIKNDGGEMIPYILEKFKEINEPSVENMYYQLAFADAKNSVQRESIERGIFRTLSEEEVKILMTPPVDPKFIGPNIPVPKLNIANINYVDEDGNSPLLVACANDNAFLVGLYLKCGADINLANNNGETPLMHAIATENHRMVEFLIDNGADVKAQTIEAKSVVNFAEEAENKTIIEKVKSALGYGFVEGQLSGYKKLKR